MVFHVVHFPLIHVSNSLADLFAMIYLVLAKSNLFLIEFILRYTTIEKTLKVFVWCCLTKSVFLYSSICLIWVVDIFTSNQSGDTLLPLLASFTFAVV